jgi:hypothetical protein
MEKPVLIEIKLGNNVISVNTRRRPSVAHQADTKSLKPAGRMLPVVSVLTESSSGIMFATETIMQWFGMAWLTVNSYDHGISLTIRSK